MSEVSDRTGSVSLRSVGVVTFLSFGQLVLLFVLQLVLAHAFGASDELDAYLSAYALPLVVGGILSGALGMVIVPLYSEIRSTSGDDAAAVALGRVGRAALIVASSLALAIWLAADAVVGVFYDDLEPSTARLTSDLLRIVVWLIPLNTLTGFLFGIDHARKRFFQPAFSGLLGPSVTVFLFVFVLERTVESLAWAVLAGGIVGVGFLLRSFPRTPKSQAGQSVPVFPRLLFLIAPLLLGAAYTRADVLVDRPLASHLDVGSISHMGYAWRLASAIVMLGTSGLSVVIFPALARHAAKGDRKQMHDDLAEGWRLLCVVFVPMIGGIVFCGVPIVQVLLQRGEFTQADSLAVARLLSLYAGWICGAGVAELASRTLYALGRTWIPSFVGIGAFALGSIAKVLIVDRFGVDGLVVVSSLYYLLNATVLILFLRWAGLLGYSDGLLYTLARSVVAASVAVLLATTIMTAPTMLRVVAGILVAAVVYIGLLLALGDEFVRRALIAARSIVLRRPQ